MRFGREASEAGGLEIRSRFPGRAVLADPDGTLYIGRNFRVLASRDEGATWNPLFALPRSPMRRAAELSRLACRLLRHEIRALARLPKGTFVAASRTGVFYGREGQAVLSPSLVADAARPYRPPMRLTVGTGGVVLWGEYTSRRDGQPIRLFASRDGGRVFEVVHTLAGKSVLHIHNIQYDAARDHYWVFAGDHGAEPGIGMLSSDLGSFEWFLRGEQRYRAVTAFDFGDRLIYATDTELETNALISLDKASGRSERLREFDGSCIYACRFGDLCAISTTVEPSPVNKSRWASLWLSADGEQWTRAFRARKDLWSANYFQFGSLVLPAGETPRPTPIFSGQALRGLDGDTITATYRLPT